MRFIKKRRRRSRRYRVWGVFESNPLEGEDFFHLEAFFDVFYKFQSNSMIFFSLYSRFLAFFRRIFDEKNFKTSPLENLANSNFQGGPLEFELARFYYAE